MALSYEYEFKIIKLNDLYIISKSRYPFYEINRIPLNSKIVLNNNFLWHIINKIFIKIFIRLIHLFYTLNPFFKSFKICGTKARPRFIFGRNLGSNFQLELLIKESKNNNIVVSGWGLRDWDLAIKHRKKIAKNLKSSLINEIVKDQGKFEKYIFVHIRRSDFLDIDEYKLLNFKDNLWIKSIISLCNRYSIKKVVIFSDDNIPKFLLSELNKLGIKTSSPVTHSKKSFIRLFIDYLKNADYVLCNASTLTLSLSYIFHDFIFLPSRDEEFQKVNINNAHENQVTSINWI